MLALCRAGAMNDDLLELVRHNVRESDQVLGDIFSCCASNDEGSRCLVQMLREYGLTDIEALSDYIVDASREAIIGRIAKLPRGTWR